MENMTEQDGNEIIQNPDKYLEAASVLIQGLVPEAKLFGYDAELEDKEITVLAKGILAAIMSSGGITVNVMINIKTAIQAAYVMGLIRRSDKVIFEILEPAKEKTWPDTED